MDIQDRSFPSMYYPDMRSLLRAVRMRSSSGKTNTCIYDCKEMYEVGIKCNKHNPCGLLHLINSSTFDRDEITCYNSTLLGQHFIWYQHCSPQNELSVKADRLTLIVLL